MKQGNALEMDSNLNTNPRHSQQTTENYNQKNGIDADMKDYESEHKECDLSDDYGSLGEKFG